MGALDYYPPVPSMSNRQFGMTGVGGGGGASRLGGFGNNNGAGGFGGSGFGFNMDTLQLGMGAIGTGFGIYNAMQQNKLAKQQFAFQKEFAMKNLANQTKAYNTSLEDRGRARAAMEGQSSEEAQSYIDNNRM